MKEKVAIVFLVFFLLGALGFNYYQWEDNKDLEYRIGAVSATAVKQTQQIDKLKTEIEYLRTRHIEPPEIIGWIDVMQLQDFLHEKLEFKKGYRNCISDVTGARYNLITKAEIERFLEIDDTDQYPYQQQHGWFDCDDLAARLVGNMSIPGPDGQPGWSSICFGEAWTHYHSFNLFITKEDGELVLYKVEASSDCIEKVEKGSLHEIWMIRF